jgi:preprotein translocase subunit SecF
MKNALIKNWPAKIASLLAAYAIWHVIHRHINEGIDFKFISEQALNQRKQQQVLQEELQRKQLEVSILQDRITQSKIDEAQKATVVEEAETKPAQPQETPPP